LDVTAIRWPYHRTLFNRAGQLVDVQKALCFQNELYLARCDLVGLNKKNERFDEDFPYEQALCSDPDSESGAAFAAACQRRSG
jgi:hypothetical protein